VKKQRISFEEVMIRPSPPATSQRNEPIFTAASAEAGAALRQAHAAGATQVRHYPGGMNGWRARGGEVAT